MYPTTGKAELPRTLQRAGLRYTSPRQVSRTVWLLGLTSLVTDVSSEMVASVLPLYLFFHLGISPLALGFIEGVYQGGAAITKLVSGVVTDRFGSHKVLAASGYLASAACKLAFLLAGSNAALLSAITWVDRLGKGLRTSPRDAMIALASPRQQLALAFGVHRALDTAGAMLGPIVGYLLLRALPGAYDAVFVTSFALALIGVAILLAFVRNPSSAKRSEHSEATTSRLALAAFSQRGVPVLVLGAAALGAATLSDAFIYLLLEQRVGFDRSYLPLLFVATPAVYFVLAIPCGRLADRVGRVRTLLSGYVLLLAAYCVTLVGPQGLTSVVATVFLLAGYYAATDGVLMALASACLPPELTASGLGLVSAANGLGRLAASVGFGYLWSQLGPSGALWLYALALLVVLLAVGLAFRKWSSEVSYAA